MVTRSAPGFLLGLFVEAGTVVAALAVRPGPPEHQAAVPERGRAAWLQVRRRTGCSGVFRAIVGRS